MRVRDLSELIPAALEDSVEVAHHGARLFTTLVSLSKRGRHRIAYLTVPIGSFQDN